MKNFLLAVAKCTAFAVAVCATLYFYYKAFVPTFEVLRRLFGESIYSDVNITICLVITVYADAIILSLAVYAGILLRENAKKVVKLRKMAFA